MKKTTRILLYLLIAVMLLAIPFAVPGGSILEEYKDIWADYAWDFGFISLFSAHAEEAEASYSLPIDFSAGLTPNPDCFTEDSYQDDSITVKLETIEEDGVVWRVAYVQLKDASQLRTGIASSKIKSNRTSKISAMAKQYNAVLAINGDYFADQETKKTYEVRMGVARGTKLNKKKDLLIIDENGDFHVFVKSDKNAVAEFSNAGHTIVNAFTFGPALISDGNLLELDTSYGYNPNGKEPRMAIGQLDTLSYVCVLAEGRNSSSSGVTHKELAAFMYDEIGCVQAYNLDGGNSATMIFNGNYYQTGRTLTNERDQSDLIYFATAVDPATWSN